MTRTRIYLVRHGQVEGFEEKRYNGQADVRLTAEGEAQFGLLQMRLRKKTIHAVYSSDLSRCLEGARLLARTFGLEPVAKPKFQPEKCPEITAPTPSAHKDQTRAWRLRLRFSK